MSGCSSTMSFIDRMRWSSRRRLAGRLTGVPALSKRHQAARAAQGDRLLDPGQRADIDHRPTSRDFAPARQGLIEPRHLRFSCRQAEAQAICKPVESAHEDAVFAERVEKLTGLRMLDEAEQRGTAADGNAMAQQQCIQRCRLLREPLPHRLLPATYRQAPSAHSRAPAPKPPKGRADRRAVARSPQMQWRSRAARRPAQRTCRRTSARRCLLQPRRPPRLAPRAPTSMKASSTTSNPPLRRKIAARSSSRLRSTSAPIRVVRIDDDGKVSLGQRIDAIGLDHRMARKSRRLAHVRHRSAPARRRGRVSPAPPPAATGSACLARDDILF